MGPGCGVRGGHPALLGEPGRLVSSHWSSSCAALRDALQADVGIDRVVLAGMGGSSLAPEVICATAGVELVTLDTTDSGQVAAALAADLDRTVLVVSSKSGGTVETDSHRRVFEKAFSDAGIDPKQRIVVVTDPGSPLQTSAEAAGYRKVFLADPNVGGRYSALTAFVVTSSLAGADIGAAARRRATCGAGTRCRRRRQSGFRLGRRWATAPKPVATSSYSPISDPALPASGSGPSS